MKRLTLAVPSVIRISSCTCALDTGDGLVMLMACGLLLRALAPDGVRGGVDDSAHGFHLADCDDRM